MNQCGIETAIFRSGNADGADSLFAEGVSQVNPKQLELVLPNDRKLKSIHGERRIFIEQLDQTELKHISQLTKQATPINKPLIEFYEPGKRGSARVNKSLRFFAPKCFKILTISPIFSAQ